MQRLVVGRHIALCCCLLPCVVIALCVTTSLFAQQPATTTAQSSGTPTGPRRVSGVIPGMTISEPQPVYPPDAKAARVQGSVVLHFTVTNTGTVENITVASGPEELRQSAIDAVKRWKYKPYQQNGETVEKETSITINYTLGDSADVVVGQIPAADETVVVAKKIGVIPPLTIYQPRPEYTELARKDKVEGVVIVSLVVDEQGLPQHLNVSRGLGDGLDENAIKAVKQYRFNPAVENGKPVAVYLNVEVNFKLF